MRRAVHGGGRGGVRGKRVRVRVTADEGQLAGSSHHELRRAVTMLAAPIAEARVEGACGMLGRRGRRTCCRGAGTVGAVRDRRCRLEGRAAFMSMGG